MNTLPVPVEQVTIEPEDELTCNYCGKHADDRDFWVDGNPIYCNSEECFQRRQQETHGPFWYEECQL